MDAETKARLRALCDEATPGEWRAEKCHVGWRVESELACINGLSAWFVMAIVHHPDEAETGYTDGIIGSAEGRAKFIAAARTYLPSLLSEVERLEQALAQARAEAFREAARIARQRAATANDLADETNDAAERFAYIAIQPVLRNLAEDIEARAAEASPKPDLPVLNKRPEGSMSEFEIDRIEGVLVATLKADYERIRAEFDAGGTLQLRPYDDLTEEQRVRHARSYNRMRNELDAVGQALRAEP